MDEIKFKVWNPDTPDVAFKPAQIMFPAYEFYKEQAEQIAEYVSGIEPTEENVKEVKKTLAQSRKFVKALSDRRIQIKKDLLQEFSEFETQVKEISGIIDTADTTVREKVRELEEAEREQKRLVILDLWNKRVTGYRIDGLIPDLFDIWLQPRYLNATTTMKTIETEMVEFLEQTEQDMNALDNFDDEYRVEYLGTLNLADAIATVKRREEMLEAVREEQVDEEVEERAAFIITGKKNIKLAEMVLKENDIEYVKSERI